MPLGLIDIDAAGLESLAKELRSAEPRFVDRRSPTSPTRGRSREAVAAIEAALGPIDVLVACAGFGTLTLVPDLELDRLRRMLEVNVFGVAESIEAVLPGMFARGRATSSGSPAWRATAASLDDLVLGVEGALIAYLEALRPGLERRGVTVTTVCPGFVRTAMSTGVPSRQ